MKINFIHFNITYFVKYNYNYLYYNMIINVNKTIITKSF